MPASSLTTISHEQAMAHLLATDAAFRTEWERAKVASAVALAVFTYRAERGLSQRALADLLGMRQPQVARLEAGDVNPTVDTLARLSRGLGLHIRIDITPDGQSPDLVPINTASIAVAITQPHPDSSVAAGSLPTGAD